MQRQRQGFAAAQADSAAPDTAAVCCRAHRLPPRHTPRPRSRAVASLAALALLLHRALPAPLTTLAPCTTPVSIVAASVEKLSLNLLL